MQSVKGSLTRKASLCEERGLFLLAKSGLGKDCVAAKVKEGSTTPLQHPRGFMTELNAGTPQFGAEN